MEVSFMKCGNCSLCFWFWAGLWLANKREQCKKCLFDACKFQVSTVNQKLPSTFISHNIKTISSIQSERISLTKQILLLPRVKNVQECDPTTDAIKYKCRLLKLFSVPFFAFIYKKSTLTAESSHRFL